MTLMFDVLLFNKSWPVKAFLQPHNNGWLGNIELGHNKILKNNLTERPAQPAFIMSSQKLSGGMLLIAIHERAIWAIVADFSISNIEEHFNLMLVSRDFFEIVTGDNRLSKTIGRNFTAVMKYFFRPFCRPGMEETTLDSFFQFMQQYEYCISGSLALASLIGADLSHESWRRSDLDIFVSNQRFDPQIFLELLCLWVRTTNTLAFPDRVKIKSSDLMDIGTMYYEYSHCWAPRQTYDYYLCHIVTMYMGFSETDNKQRIQFIFVNAGQVTPKDYCEGMFDYTFLMNTFTVGKNWKTPTFSIQFPRDVIEKDGTYSVYFSTQWEDEWNRWQDSEMLSKNPTLADQFKRRQRKAERLTYRRSKYEARGFFFHGPIPQRKFSNFRKPFLKRQLGRGERPNLPPVWVPMQNVLCVIHDDEEQDIRYCSVMGCSVECFIYDDHLDMYLCYEHRNFTRQDQRRMQRDTSYRK